MVRLLRQAQGKQAHHPELSRGADERIDMALKEELGLKTDFASPAHEALLNIYYTASMTKKRADGFWGRVQRTGSWFWVLHPTASLCEAKRGGVNF